MISQTAEYALRAIVYLADQGGNARTVTLISDATQVPASYLAKVMRGLGRARLVKSQRGLNGGFSLAGNPHELSVLDVVNAVDPIQRFPECPLGIVNHGRRLCPLHKKLDDAAQLAEDVFGETTVSELLATSRARKPLCRFPEKQKSAPQV